MAEFSQIIIPFRLPNHAQAMALRVAAERLTLVGRQTATSLLDGPSRREETKLLASISHCLRSGAARWKRLVKLRDHLAAT